MKSDFEHHVDKFREETVEHWARHMLSRSKRTIDLDTVSVDEFQTDRLTELSCSVNPDELVARGRLRFVKTQFGRQRVSEHSFTIREPRTGVVTVKIADHANVL